MTTLRVNLDPTRYVKVTIDAQLPSALYLQSHGDTVRIVVSDTQPSLGNVVFHELSDNMELSMTESPVWVLSMSPRSALTVTQQRLPIEVSDRDGIGGAVFVQDQTTDILDLLFLERLGTFQLAADTSIDSRFIQVVAGHNITAGNIVELHNGSKFQQDTVLSVVGDVVELDNPLGDVYITGVDQYRSNRDMRVDGSVTPVVFSIRPNPAQSGDITAIKWAIQSQQSMDFTSFGSVSPLTRGCLLRVKRADGTYNNIFNFKSNGGLTLRGFNHYFQEKSGGGLHSFVAKIGFNGQEQRGVVVRVDGEFNEELQIVVQDNLLGLNQALINASAIGSSIQG